MTTSTRPVVIRFKKRGDKKQTSSWKCSCGEHRTGFRFEVQARMTAQAHSDFHFDHGDSVSIELGGLL